MAGLSAEQFAELKKLYQGRRDRATGPRFPGEDLAQAIREIEAVARLAGGDVQAQFAEMARLRRAIRPNPLKTVKTENWP